MPTAPQKLAVTLAFVAAALSFGVAAAQLFRDGSIRVIPIAGGLLMLALGISGVKKLKN